MNDLLLSSRGKYIVFRSWWVDVHWSRVEHLQHQRHSFRHSVKHNYLMRKYSFIRYVHCNVLLNTNIYERLTIIKHQCMFNIDTTLMTSYQQNIVYSIVDVSAGCLSVFIITHHSKDFDFKAITTRTPHYLSELVQPYESSRQLRSRGKSCYNRT